MKQVENFQKVLSAGFPGSSKLKVTFGPIFRKKRASLKFFFALASLSTKKYFKKKKFEKICICQEKNRFFRFFMPQFQGIYCSSNSSTK